MTPDELQMLHEAYAWMKQRQHQQISYPLDLASAAALGFKPQGAGSKSLTQTVGTGGGSATVPAAYSGSFIIVLNGSTYEFPYL